MPSKEDAEKRKQLVEALLELDFKAAAEIIDEGFDLNLKHEESGWSALHFLVEQAAVEPTRWLLAHGADPNARDSYGWTPLLHAIDAESDAANQEWVVSGQYPPRAVVSALLLEFGADHPNADLDGKTPLQLAVDYRNTDAIDVLKRYGAR